ncbi:MULTISPECIES: TetR/AcrR family transcriptional regulator C-terminal domain-containing protein [Clostridium]|uniref:TetR/AcrR family transcriptional regulator C-terminal domain-containing protein n=1 Tax=Clostridium TaxID=1485 RepID=UPI001899AFD6|nr:MULTISPECIES: TetR/AcrR family transcriptional regulator C-terminal domain-containing protein [Clostridium]MCR1951162.1 TetR/AcrR family transcriptional regulator C-terminal domain-containing protein [Clostridium sp. DSM 100503]MDI9218319.1 TetR/AcrR family transcriptional regulator C-terminal domain-containing protein [Clostridium tertium]
MSNSQITEMALANALKKLMNKHSINKITVKEVTDECGITRRTFYNHFNDTYELLEWIYEHEVIEELEQYYNLDGWKTAITIVLQYTIDNKKICLNTFNSLGRDHLEKFLYNIFYNALQGVTLDIIKDMDIDENIKNETIRFYTLAIVGEFILWLKDNLKEEPQCILDRIEIIMTGTISYVMMRNDKRRK